MCVYVGVRSEANVSLSRVSKFARKARAVLTRLDDIFGINLLAGKFDCF